MSNLVRFGVSIEEKLLEEFDSLITESYDNRSEAIRDLIRKDIFEERLEKLEGDVIGTLTLLYDHHQRGLTEKMLNLQHDYHSLFKSNLHLHLTHELCLEVIVVAGDVVKIKNIAGRLIGLKGVKHGKLTFTTFNEAEKVLKNG